MKIGTNISALQASRQLNDTSRAINRALQRLSTGKRVISPRDDLAAYRLGVNLDAQVRGLRQANLNINIGVGVVQTASAAIQSQIDIAQKMRELAVQGASGTLSSSDRANINKSLTALLQQFSQITNETEFNGLKLLNGNFSEKVLQIGAEANQTYNLGIGDLKASELFEKSVSSGSFSPAETVNIGGTVGDTEVADVNNDGIDDILSLDLTNDLIFVHLGDSSGSFSSSQTLAMESTVGNFDLGDVDGDGIVDIVSANSTDASFSVYLGNGDGSFDTGMTLAHAGTTADEIQLFDVNQDGLDDIVTSGNFGIVDIYHSNGDGSFDLAQTIDPPGSGGGGHRPALGDIDNDGYIDLAVASGNETIIYLGQSDGTFVGSGNQYTTAANNTTDLEFADLNSDGFLDLVALNNTNGLGGTDRVEVLMGNGDGSFDAPVDYALLSANGLIADAEIVDIDADGILDVVVADSNGVTYFLGNGDGTLQSGVTIDDDDSDMIAAVDLNGDGALDLVTADGSAETFSLHYGVPKTVTAVADFNVSSIDNAQALIDIIDNGLEALQSELSSLATAHDRLDLVASHNLLKIEDAEKARGDALDADFSLEVAELVRQQVLQAAQVAVVSQANVNAQVVLELLNF